MKEEVIVVFWLSFGKSRIWFIARKEMIEDRERGGLSVGYGFEIF